MAPEPALAIVQARTGSTRFPGKVLAPFAGTTVLRHILDRLRRTSSPLDLVVATTDLAEDDAVADVCADAGVPAFRGASDDVLGRFVACVNSRPVRPGLVLRICADRPLLCPVLVDELLWAYAELDAPDYLANNLPPSYPDGLDLELVRTECLEQANGESVDAYEREHVTPFVYTRPQRFRLENLVCPFGNFSDVRLALDTRDDHERLVQLHALLPEEYDYRDVLTAVELTR
jgi:spore coat polysaccharide biosynthesis protein SpsF (cytidylyltransferase family)